MRILILSDLHIGPSARCLSLVPEVDRLDKDGKPDHGFLKEKSDQEYIKRLETLKNAKGVEIDYLILAGDLTDKATIEQFEHFDWFLSEVQKIFNLPTDKILFTPGNHDVDWSILKGTPKINNNSTRFNARYDSLKKSVHLSSILELADADLFSSPYFCSWIKSDLFVLSVNTAAYDSPDVKQHTGEINENTIGAIRKYMEAVSLEKSIGPRILLMH